MKTSEKVGKIIRDYVGGKLISWTETQEIIKEVEALEDKVESLGKNLQFARDELSKYNKERNYYAELAHNHINTDVHTIDKAMETRCMNCALYINYGQKGKIK